uniref:Three-Cys-motif partner protein n=1 Tax=Candidatus Kentrum sp. MB TaxID=2138164 RepID=A0A450X3F0_9GAMM|nr:MAG: three-Cys-motif partner protein [Candidatus Kentron sp. MB]VFK26706.1 MAG: three-Cys-motif partner protein [Candidatus Kentron sp. MB]VFK74603.1 MAG: three-Cys-motif partner protein [Candidatus Kentron sp. MB]
MPITEHDWHLGGAPPKIGLHSLAKHQVYEEYLQHYIRVLSLNPNITTFPLVLIDSFSGGGVYTDPRDNSLYPGSPLRLLKAAKVGEAQTNLDRKQRGIYTLFTLQAEFFFIEKKPSNHEYLKWYLSGQGFASRFDKDLFLLKGEFTKWLDEIIQHIEKRGRNRRCLFFLDQYGYKDVPFNKIRAIFSRLPHAEIILTLPRTLPSTTYRLQKMNSDGGNRSNVLVYHKSISTKFKKKKRTIKDWRQVIQFGLHHDIWSQSGAQFYTPFFIASEESNRSYWLVHLSNHEKARDVMTELHWDLKNHFSHYGGPGLWMFGYDPRKVSSVTGQIDLFSGIEYSFDGAAKDRTRQTILEQLPKLIYEFPDGIPYRELYRQVANTTPATSKHIKEVATLLLQMKELEVRGPNNERRCIRIEKNDILRCTQQTIM